MRGAVIILASIQVSALLIALGMQVLEAMQRPDT